MERRIYRISGNDSARGAARSFFVSAASEMMARDFASRRGVVISEIVEVEEPDVPEGVPVLPAHERRPQVTEWLPWLDFSFLPPSGYLIVGVACVVLGITSSEELETLPLTAAVAGSVLIVLGCVRFAAYQRHDD